jgi:hypothetical protein
MSATINAQADAAMARVHQHINRCAAQQARRMTEGWARAGTTLPPAPAAAPATPTTVLPPPGQRGSVVMLDDTGPAGTVGTWARQTATAGVVIAAVVACALAAAGLITSAAVYLLP